MMRKNSGSQAACSLPRDAQDERLEALADGLFSHLKRVVEFSDGYGLVFVDDPAIRSELNAFVRFERQCCSFATYAIRESGDDEVVLELRGPEGTKELLAGWMARVR